MSNHRPHHPRSRTLYTPDERRRRDASRWTLAQGILAPVQFVVFLVSLGLVLRYLATGEGLAAATASIVVKTLVLYAIMLTGSIWEKEVFGRYLFARAFFWEDVFSMLVLALHTAYLCALGFGLLDARQQMLLALAAYATYVINATQFLLKLRAARLEERRVSTEANEVPKANDMPQASDMLGLVREAAE
jgi:3-vinyl bacteriochlorophyllide hydratase